MKQISDEIYVELANQVQDVITDDTMNKVTLVTFLDVSDKIWDPFRNDVSNEIFIEIEDEIRDELLI